MTAAPWTNPPVTAELVEAARSRPGGWVYAVDPAFDADAGVPGWAVQGGWQVDGSGHISGDFIPNPGYRPSPRALGLAEPTNELERILQTAAVRGGQDTQLLRSVLDSEIILFARSPGDDQLFVHTDESGERVIQAFSSEVLLPAEWTSWQRRHGRELVKALTGCVLELNPGSPVSVRLPGEALAAAAISG